MPCPAGRGPSSCRSASSPPTSRSGNLPPEFGIAELFVQPPQHAAVAPSADAPAAHVSPTSSWPSISCCKFYESCGLTFFASRPWPGQASWMRDHFADSDGVGAIFPPIIYTIISLRCLGYADDSPEMIYALKQLDDLMIEEDDTIRLQPCFSPVWDTAPGPQCPGLDRHLSSRSGGRTGVALAARPRMPSARRLEPAQSRPGTVRLVLRIPQRLLSRHRRHRHGADGLARTGQAWEQGDGQRAGNGSHGVRGSGRQAWRVGPPLVSHSPAVERS